MGTLPPLGLAPKGKKHNLFAHYTGVDLWYILTKQAYINHFEFTLQGKHLTMSLSYKNHTPNVYRFLVLRRSRVFLEQ